jgi:putative DNA primase/helicase
MSDDSIPENPPNHKTTLELEKEAGRKAIVQRKVISLAERAQEVIAITELEPHYNQFIGKQIGPDGTISQYPDVKWWRQHVAHVPATIPHLFAYLREARKRNICLIRGAPANPERQPTLRQRAGLYGREDRGDHGFLDEPTKLLALDIDGVKTNWRADPEAAVRAVVADLFEPWASASFVWFLSGTCGLERDKRNKERWTGRIIDGNLRVRLMFITERPLQWKEADELTKFAKAIFPKIDPAISRVVQPNYIKRPQWVERPNCDVLGDIPTIGWVRGAHDYLEVPEYLAHEARWAQAQGHGADIADHPDAESAVRSVGSDGSLRAHLMSAVIHLLIANPIPDVVSFTDHSLNITDKLRELVQVHRAEIDGHLTARERKWAEVHKHLEEMPAWALWCLHHPGVLRTKTIRLVQEESEWSWEEETEREAIFARVERTIENARSIAAQAIAASESAASVGDQNKHWNWDVEWDWDAEWDWGAKWDWDEDWEEEWDQWDLEERKRASALLLVAPTGSRKSTLIRAAAVRYVTENAVKTVVILVPRHRLGDEQIKQLHEEHPDGNYRAAVWRGRHAWNPAAGDGREEKMCRRSEEAEYVEKALLNVESSLCKHGRGKATIKCPFYDTCAYQRQKRSTANIWFAAHECAVHEMPQAFGDVGWVIFDESPLDAFMLGTDSNDQVTLELDTLRTSLPVDRAKFGHHDYNLLMRARAKLYRALDTLRLPIGSRQGVAVPLESLSPFSHANNLRKLTWRGKVKPAIRPDVSEAELKIKLHEATAINNAIKKEVILWQLIEAADGSSAGKYGRIQVHHGKRGRVVRMVGMKPLAKGWNAPTLISDATGDAELLRANWPQLQEAEPHGWEQLPRPPGVRIFQCVDRTISKWAVAVEGKHPKELNRKIEGARRLYAAVLTKALEYGGAEVGVITYKSTKDWIAQNCFVPPWLKLAHWGDVVGTNSLQNVRALFVIGRPLASPEDVTRQAEALFGTYIPEREYEVGRKQGRIPIVPDAKGNNCILVDVHQHPDPMAERLRRQITEGAIIQAAGRARAGLREADEPLDIHIWTDVPVPELGAVEPVLWAELEAGLDGLMLASGGIRLECAEHAAAAYSDLFSLDGLKWSRKTRSRPFAYVVQTTWTSISYQRKGRRQHPAKAFALMDPGAARAWLEEKLGPLAYFEVGEHRRPSRERRVAAIEW